MKNIKILDHYSWLFILVLFILSFSLGYKYTLYNQDFHHWAYIHAQFIEFKNNQSLYKDIFLQYGPGQIIFFYFLNFFYKIDIITLGLTFNLIYSLNFLILYKIFKHITSKKLSILIIYIIFFLHPFNILPWPDYISGFFLNLFIYLFLKIKIQKKSSILLAILLFASTFFRQSYFISIFLGIILFSIINLILIKKNNFKWIFNYFIIFNLIYFFTLYFFGNFSLHISQFAGSIELYANETNNTEIKEKIISEYGYNWWIILRLFYFILRFLKNLINFYSIESIILILSIIIVLIFFYNLKYKNLFNNNYTKKIILISLLGTTGLIQSFYNFEVFRFLNSSMGIFIGATYYVFHLKKNILGNINLKTNKNFTFFTLIFVLMILIFSFVNNLIKTDILRIKYQDFANFKDNDFFGKKKIKLDSLKYYNEIAEIICKKEYLTINQTHDLAISYLCKNLKNPIPNMINASFHLKKFDEKNFNNIYFKKFFLLSYKEIGSKDYEFIKKIFINHDNWPHSKFLYIYSKKTSK